MVMRDIACAGYVAGGNTQFFTKDDDGTFKLTTGDTKMEDRLAFSEAADGKYASMLAFPCTEQQMAANMGLDTVMSVTSRLLPWETTGANAAKHSSFPGGEEVFQEYNKKLGLNKVHYGEDVKVCSPCSAHSTRLPTSLHSPCKPGGREPRVCEPGIHQQRNLLFGPPPPL